MITKPPIRGQDSHGAGHWHAPRAGRLHNGVDLACYPGTEILSICAGTVTKFGRPYYIENPQTEKDKLKNKMRHVQITDSDGLEYSYFYVEHHPTLAIDDKVKAGDILGVVQDLTKIYKGMTNHVHLRIQDEDGEYLDPTPFVS